MTKNKEKITRVVVWIIIVGLVGAYIPLLFTPPEEVRAPQPNTRQVTVPLISQEDISTTSSSPNSER